MKIRKNICHWLVKQADDFGSNRLAEVIDRSILIFQNGFFFIIILGIYYLLGLNNTL
jgi:hypothetical protein